MNYKEIVVNLDIISKFLKRHKLPKLIQEDMKNLSSCTSRILGSKQKLPAKKRPGLNAFSGILQMFKKE